MSYHEGEKARLGRRLSQEAIALAMQGQWEEAVVVNQSIIASVPTDVDAYNRLGRAFMELGEFGQAREAYRKALEFAPGNVIAKKNLDRLSLLGEARVGMKDGRRKVAPRLFVAEMGKAGVVYLDHLAPQEILAKMAAGDQVYLKVKGQRLIVENEQEEYLGEVELRHAIRLIKLIEGGNEYIAAIVGLDDRQMKVIIRETLQHPDQIGRPSFPVKESGGFRPHVKDTLLRRDEDEEADYLQLEEEVELLPDGFSIFNGTLSVEDGLAEEESTEEE